MIFLLEQFGWNYTSGASGTNLGPGVRDPEGSGGPTRGEHLAASEGHTLAAQKLATGRPTGPINLWGGYTRYVFF